MQGKPNVGILSMQRVQNSGSFLQAYGLQHALQGLGCQTQFVDFHLQEPSGFKQKLKSSHPRLWGAVRQAKSVLQGQNRPARETIRLSDAFEHQYDSEFFPLLSSQRDFNFAPALDLLVIGSDEVFNCAQYADAGKQIPWELYGEGNRAKRLISYAASFGATTLEDLERLGIREKAAKLLNSFSALSVRDDNSSEIVQVLTGKTPQLHIDPVLLYPFSEILLEKPEPFDYILVYAYNNRLRAEEAEQIQAFAKRHGKRLLCVNNFQDFCEEKRVASPLKVLSYFRFADYVITDTFHGSVLSIKYHRPFGAFIRTSNRQKMSFLLHQFGLDSRKVEEPETLAKILETPISYQPVDEILLKKQGQALEYLSRCLERISPQ